jgi:predicted membrane protein
MSRLKRQPTWWIVLALVYSAINLFDFTRYATNVPSLMTILSVPLELCVILGASAFAFGYRFGSERFWQAIAVLYVADWAPSLIGIIFRLARHAVNDRYVIYRSPESYFVTIFILTFGLLAVIRFFSRSGLSARWRPLSAKARRYFNVSRNATRSARCCGSFTPV